MFNQGIPQLIPGFRFKPTDKELVRYLKKKANSEFDAGFIFIPDIDRGMEPWDIKAKAKILGDEGQEEWYYFVLNKGKYARGTKIYRTTETGYWKASGVDKAVVSKSGTKIGTKRSLVFYKGRAPNGKRTNWTTYEYRLLTSQHGPPDQPQEYQEWVVCKGLEKSPNSCNPSSTMHHNDPPNPAFNQTSSSNQLTFNPSHPDQDILISSQIGFENQPVDELQQLNSIAYNMGANYEDQSLHVQNSIAYNMGADYEDQGLHVQNSMAYNMGANYEDQGLHVQNSMAYNMGASYEDQGLHVQYSMAYNMGANNEGYPTTYN